MKKRVLAALFLLLATVSPAAAKGPYLGAAAATAVFHDADYDGAGGGEVEYQVGFAVNASAGMPFKPLRLELDYGYARADTKGEGGEFTIMSLMLNGYYDIELPSAPVSPFLGAGLGYLYGSMDGKDVLGRNVDDSDTAFGYQLTAGVTRHINDYLDLDVYYRFQSALSDFELEPFEAEYDASMLFAALRYRIW